jgi:hypothetical protein
MRHWSPLSSLMNPSTINFTFCRSQINTIIPTAYCALKC